VSNKIIKSILEVVPRLFKEMPGGTYAEENISALEDKTGTQINPAKEDGNLALIFEWLNTTLSWGNPQGIDVGVSSSQILAANTNRKGVVIVNDSDSTIYLSIGTAAEMNKGIRLNANGGSYEMNWSNLSTQAINGIHGASGNKRVCVMEAT
jgi:hypothetical protein